LAAHNSGRPIPATVSSDHPFCAPHEALLVQGRSGSSYSLFPVERWVAHPLFHAGGNPGLLFFRCPPGAGEGDDASRVHAVGHELSEALRDDLGLAGACGGDDLRVGAAVQNGLEGIVLKLPYV
jgi:hypothetical protein